MVNAAIMQLPRAIGDQPRKKSASERIRRSDNGQKVVLCLLGRSFSSASRNHIDEEEPKNHLSAIVPDEKNKKQRWQKVVLCLLGRSPFRASRRREYLIRQRCIGDNEEGSVEEGGILSIQKGP